jgi:hypothetical protein
MNETIRIHYAPNEIGHAELLGDKLARIVDVPVFTNRFWRDDIVRLTHLPNDDVPIPGIEEVVFTRHERRSIVTFDDDFAANKLMDIFALLGAEAAVILPAKEDKFGHISVAHAEALDVGAVARISGLEVVPFPDDDKTTIPRSAAKRRRQR